MTKRLAFVTGGAGGIGFAICRELAARGHRVVAGYHPGEEAQAHDTQALWRREGYEIAIVAGDVASYSSCEEMREKISTDLGTVEILVNCAGITRDHTLKNLMPKDWNDVISVNLDSVYNVTRQFIGGMVERGWGRVINISSVNGKKGQFGQSNYAASKAGMHGFTMSLAQEVAKKGVTANSISPGYIDTRLTRAIPPQIAEQIRAQIPAGYVGKPEDVAYVAGFLADERAAYITGANISADGGLFTSF